MNTTQIRKISVGSGNVNNMMHYQIDKEHIINQEKIIVTDIVLDRDLLGLGKIGYNIYILSEKGGAKLLWKTLVDVPMIIENNISFD